MGGSIIAWVDLRHRSTTGCKQLAPSSLPRCIDERMKVDLSKIDPPKKQVVVGHGGPALKVLTKVDPPNFLSTGEFCRANFFLQRGTVFSLLRALVWKYVMKVARIAAVPDISSLQNF